MSWLSDLLHPGRAYQAAEDTMKDYYNQGVGYQQPYQQAGVDSYSYLQDMLKNLSDPEALQSKWAEGYQESPYAKTMEEQAKQRGLDAASSMGILGSTPAMNAIQTGTTNIMNADRQQYLNDLMDKYKTAMGLGENIYGTGASTASNMAQNATNFGQKAAEMEYGRRSAGRNILEKLLGTATGFGGEYAMNNPEQVAKAAKWFVGA